MTGPDYFDVLALVIAKADPRIQYDHWMGTVYVSLPGGGDLYATPGWEGDALPWAVVNDGTNERHGNINAQWSGRLRDDLALFMSHLERLLARLSD